MLFFVIIYFTCLSFSYAQNQPSQAPTGPGGMDYIHGGVTEYFTDNGSESYWIYQPAQPAPDSADLVIFNHGRGQINPMVHAEWITHLVKKGNIVVYPKYQDDLNTPSDSFVYYAVEGIKAAIAEMQNPSYVQPRLNNFAMIGHSYGGAISADLTYNYLAYNLPRVKALMVAQGYYGTDIALPSYVNFPYNTKMQIVVGANDNIVGNTLGRLLMDSANVDPAYKNYITHHGDAYGSPSVTATHSDPVCISPNNDYDSGESNYWVLGAQLFNKVDVVDYYCYWKLSEALLDCTFRNQNCDYAFGDTPNQRYMGTWTDGTPIRELEIEAAEPNSISILNNTTQWTIAPNPTNGQVIIKSKEGQLLKAISVYSNLGQLVDQYDVANEQQYTLELPELNGLYHVVLETETSRVSQIVIKH